MRSMLSSRLRFACLGLGAAALVFWAPFLPRSSAGLRALVITEVMYHPPEADDKPFEYIELYNEVGDPLDLTGYRICNGVDFEFPPGTWLDGHAFLVVCASQVNIRTKYGITNTVGDWYVSPATSPSLSNAGEKIEICNTGGKTIVQVHYNDRGKWPSGADGTGHSLEILSPFAEVDDPDSWALSNDLGGSPGAQNPCWDPDVVPPPPGAGGGPVGSFTDRQDVGLPCVPGDTTFVSATGRYSISGSGADIWQGGDQFQFAYVKVEGNFDIKARLVSRAWSTSRWGKGGIMARQDLTSSSRYAFVHDNPDPDGARMAIRPTHGGSDNAEPFVLADGTHPTWYRLQRTATTITGSYSANGTAWTAFGDMAWSGGTTVYLGLALTSHSSCDPLATLVFDQLTITGTILPPDPGGGGGPPPPKPCLGRIPVRINEAYLRTTGGAEPWIELYNKGAAAESLSGYYLTDDPLNLTKYAIPNGTSIGSKGFLTFTESQLGFGLTTPAGVPKLLALTEPSAPHRVVDAFKSNPQFDGYSEARIPGDDKAFSGAADPTFNAVNSISASTSVVINEVMYHPIDNDNRKEYVELYNKGPVALDLTGWSLSDGLKFDLPPGTVIPSGGYLVIARDPALMQSIYGLTASEVIGPATPEALLAFGVLSNRGERLTLSDQLGRTVDTVRYHDGGEWPHWPDGLGSSLELIDVSQDNRLGQAWDASDDAAKATTQSFSYVGRHQAGESELAMILTDRGITLVDDVSIIGGGVTTSDSPLIDAGEVWKYIKGTQAPPVNWTSRTGFDDTAWLSGPTGIGYGDNDDATVLSDMQNGYLTIFCRKSFNVPNVSAIDQLVLSVVIDDGFYAYLNGTQVASDDVTSPAFDAPAPAAIEPHTVEVDLTAQKGLLVNGTNVLAIQVHNAGLASTDLSFNPRLLDRVTTVGGGTEQVANGTFDLNTSGWMIEGTHIRSGRTTQNPIHGAGSLKILAAGGGDNKVNRIETPEAGGFGLGSLNLNEDLLISFKARWVVGAQTLVTNGFEHEYARAHTLAAPLNLGTPGRRNSVTARQIALSGGNLGPVITNVGQVPAVPGPSESVTVKAKVLDPDGLGAVTLRYSLNNPSAAPASVPMTLLEDNVYQATIPAQAQGTRVVYFITATDAGGRAGRYPIDITTRTHPLLLNPPSATINDHRYCVYRHDVKNPPTGFQSYRFWMTQNNEDTLSNRRLLSNDFVDGSFVFGGSTIYYESQTHFSGSPWARGGWGGSFRLGMPRDNPLHGRIRKFNLEDNQGNGADARTRITHYLLRQSQGGSPVPYTEGFSLVRWQVNDRVVAVREHNWVPDTDFLSLWFRGDEDGDFLEMDDRFVIDDNGNRIGSSDGRVLYPPPSSRSDGNGANKENYRYFFNVRAKNGADEYANFIAFARVMDPAATPDASFDQQIFDFADVEAMLRIWAIEMNIDDWDSWGQSRGKNLYFYRTEADGRMHMIGWDFELTYADINSFIIPPSPADPFNPGGFGEVNRMMNRPVIRRMYYAILDEMVNGPNRWFHSDYLGDLAGRLAAFGMANTAPAQPGGFIDQRAALLSARIQSVVYPQVRLTITTNGGSNFSSAQPAVNISGNTPVNVADIIVNTERYPLRFNSMTTWTMTGILLQPGPNNLTFFGYDLQGNLVDSDSITVTLTVAWNPPAIASLNPTSTTSGTDIEVLGSDFHNGLRVFFGGVESSRVVYDENGSTPDKIIARVPGGSGTVNVTVKNIDNQSSNVMAFTYVPPPSNFIRGDANGNETIEIADAVKALLHLFAGAATNCEDSMDVDDDETLNVTDVISLLNYLFKSGAAPGAPFPTAGVDPAGTQLGCQR
jgi:hypothetical protein